MMRAFLVIVILLGYLWIGVAGTGTKVVFQWPGLILLGIGFVMLPLIRCKDRRASPPLFCSLAVVALFAYMVTRASMSPVSYLARIDVILALTLFGFYIVFSTCLSGSRARLCFLFLLLLLGIANTCIAVYQLQVDLGFNILPGYERQGSGGQLLRPGGFFNLHPHFAGFLEITVLFGVAIGVFAHVSKSIRAATLICAAIALVGIALSQSRGVFLGLVPGGMILAVIFFMRLRGQGKAQWAKRNITRWAFGIVAITCVVGIVAFSAFSKRFDSVDQAFSISSRGNFWAGAIDQWISAPVFGTGARSFHYQYPAYRPPEAPFHQRDPEFAHNDYLQQAAEYGIVGLLLVLLVLFAHVFHAARKIRDHCRSRDHANRPSMDSLEFALVAGALAVIGAHLFQAFVDFHVRLPVTGLAIVFCLAVVANPNPKPRDNQPGHSGVDLGIRWAAALCGIALVVFFARFGKASWELEKGHLQVKGGSPDLAVVHLQKAIELDPANADPWRSLGLIRYFKKEANLPAFVKVQFQGKARAAYLKAIEIHPFDGFSHIGAGNCEMFLAWHGAASDAGGYWQSAREHFENAISLAPTKYKPREAHALYRLNYAYYLNRIGRLQDAAKEAKLALVEFKRVPEFFVQGAPRGHRAGSGAKSALALIKQLKDRQAAKVIP
ncbi:MAG: O-antigen ligase family protein [Verrucomicrobiota bacterium]|nr:O-antigen ligase family protein [Verrucomicrobiota bacterium]